MINLTEQNKVQIEVEFELSDSLLVDIENLSKYSDVPQINITAVFLEAFNKFLIADWEPLFVKVINVESGEVLGIVPLMFHSLKRKGVLPYRVIKFFGSTFSDFHDIYSKQENKDIVIASVLDWLFAKFKWQEIILDDLLDSASINEPLLNYLNSHNLRYSHEKGKYFYISLIRDWNEIESDTSKSFVWKNVRLAKNRINKAGNWEIEYNPLLNEDEILNKVAPIHINRQEALGKESVFKDQLYISAYKKIIQHALQLEQFQTFWLRFDGKDIGYMLGFYLKGVFYWWSTGFLEEFKKYYPSRLLQFYVLKHMHENGYKEFNFMRGESGYKDKWTKTSRTNHRIRVYNNKNLYGKAIGIFDKKFR